MSYLLAVLFGVVLIGMAYLLTDHKPRNLKGFLRWLRDEMLWPGP